MWRDFYRFAWTRPGCVIAAVAIVGLSRSVGAQVTTTTTFGDEAVYDVNRGLDQLGVEPIRVWDTGDDLLLRLQESVREGKITGKRDQLVVPEVKLFGETIVPEVRADTRRGATIDASIDVTTGMVLGAFMDFTGADITGTLGIVPELTYQQQVLPGRLYSLNAQNRINPTSTFQGDLPVVGVFADFVLDARLVADVAAAIPGVLPYSTDQVIADTEYQRVRLLQLDTDLGAAEGGGPPTNIYDIAFPDDPLFNGFDQTIADKLESDPDDSLFRFKIPPNDPNTSIGELQLVNPGPGLRDGQTAIADNKVTYTTRGDFLRLGVDIDGLITKSIGLGAALGSEVPLVAPGVTWGKLKYDLIDVKYGPELSYQTRTEVTPNLEVTLNFDREVLIDVDGLLQTASSWSGDWTKLPDFALISRDDVHVDVDFTQLTLNGIFANDLVLSDYFEIRGGEISLKLQAGVVPIPIAKLGPLLYKKLDPLGDGIAFEIFAEAFELGSYDLGETFDGSFSLEAAPLMEVYLLSENDSLTPGDFAEFGSTAPVAGLADKALVLGVSTAVDGTAPQTRLDPILAGAGVFDSTGGTLAVDGLVLLDDSVYALESSASRTFELGFIENHGDIENVDGNLVFRNPGGVLNISGSGSTFFEDNTTFAAALVTHGEGHELRFNGNGFTPNQTIQAQIVDNAGRIAADSAARLVVAADTQFRNAATGRVEARFGGDIELRTTGFGGFNAPDVVNAGLIEADGAGSSVLIDAVLVRGASDLAMPGRFLAHDGGSMRLTDSGESMYLLGATHFTAGANSSITFDRQLFVMGDVVLETAVGGTISLNGMGLDFQYDDSVPRARIINRGTLDILADNSLVPRPPGSQTPVVQPSVTPIDLLNEGTINVRNNADFEFNVRIDNFANGGAVFSGGTWNILGDAGPFSNLTTSYNPETVTSITINVAEIEQDSVIFDLVNDLNDGFDDVFDSPPDTFLKTNEANVRLHGRASFPYFNTVQINRGDFTISGGHQFSTAGSYTNQGGTTLVTGDHSRLNVAGPLFVDGGNVFIEAGAGFTVQTGQITLDDDTPADRTVQVIGGQLTVVADDNNPLDDTPMFFDRAASNPSFVGLNAGQAWIVREGVAVDPGTGVETVTPAAINLRRYYEVTQIIDQPFGLPDLEFNIPMIENFIIERNNGTIVIDGENARFDAAEAMQYNHGQLTLANGFEFNTRLADFRNAPEATLTLEGASFIVESSDGTGQFRNDGTLAMDIDSYLRTDHFINGGVNGPNARLLLDGVLDAERVTISAGTVITGSGTITGSIANAGTLDLGNSPGRIVSFGSYVQSDSGTATFEIQGHQPGTTYDQLVIQQVENQDPNDPQPLLMVSVDGVLELLFADQLAGRPNAHWLLIDNQGASAIQGTYDQLLVTGLDAGNPLDTGNIDTTGDIYLGHLGDFATFLTYAGHTGNDLVVYTVPEPTTAIVLAAIGLASTIRRGARRA